MLHNDVVKILAYAYHESGDAVFASEIRVASRQTLHVRGFVICGLDCHVSSNLRQSLIAGGPECDHSCRARSACGCRSDLRKNSPHAAADASQRANGTRTCTCVSRFARYAFSALTPIEFSLVPSFFGLATARALFARFWPVSRAQAEQRARTLTRRPVHVPGRRRSSSQVIGPSGRARQQFFTTKLSEQDVDDPLHYRMIGLLWTGHPIQCLATTPHHAACLSWLNGPNNPVKSKGLRPQHLAR